MAHKLEEQQFVHSLIQVVSRQGIFHKIVRIRMYSVYYCYSNAGHNIGTIYAKGLDSYHL